MYASTAFVANKLLHRSPEILIWLCMALLSISLTRCIFVFRLDSETAPSIVWAVGKQSGVLFVQIITTVVGLYIYVAGSCLFCSHLSQADSDWFTDVHGRMMFCGEDEFYDDVVDLCSKCSDICAVVNDFCTDNCPGIVSVAVLSPVSYPLHRIWDASCVSLLSMYYTVFVSICLSKCFGFRL